jgi:deferrochelatase/peroxidase EfeB
MADTQLSLAPIPFETAVELCAQIRAETEINWQTASAKWCYQCQQITGNDPAKRGFLRAPDNRGCIVINSMYAEMKS